MSWLICCNVLLLLYTGYSFFSLKKEFNRSMFVGVGALYAYGGVVIPGLFAFFNLVLLLVFYPAYFWLSFLPLVIPLTIFLVLQVNNYRGGREYDNFKLFGDRFIHDARRHGIHLFEQDVRVRIMNKKKMEYLLNVYGDDQEAKLKPLLKKYEEMAQAEFEDYNIRIYIDKQREPRPEGKTA